MAPGLFQYAGRISDLIDDQMDVPGSLGSPFDVPDPEELIVSFPVLFPDLPDRFLEILSCGLQIPRPFAWLIGPCSEAVSWIKIL